jgi:hypothetical protein
MRWNLLRLFNDPDTGASGGGGSSPGGAGTGSGVVPAQNGATQGGADEPIVTPWDAIDLETLDEQTRSVTEAGIKAFKEQVTANRNLQKTAEQAIQTSRRFQSEYDRLNAQVNPPKQEEVDQFEVETANYMRSQGYAPEVIKAQSKLLGGLMKHLTGTVIKREIGADLAPLANTVVGQENTYNFTAAQQSEVGAELLGIPEVAQQVWEAVGKRTEAGAVLNADAILNLAKMFHYDHIRANPGARPMLPNPPAPGSVRPTVNTSLNFPGSGAFLRPNNLAVPNAGGGPALNADTQAALEQTFGALENATGIAPTAYKGAGKRLGGRR